MPRVGVGGGLTQDGRKPEAARQFRSQTRGLPGRAGACDSFYLNIDRLSGQSRSLRLQSAWHKAQALSHPAPPTGRRGPGDPGGLPRGRFRGQRRPRCHPPRSPLPARASSPRAAEGLRAPLPHRRALSRALVTILAPTAPSQLRLQTGPRPPPHPSPAVPVTCRLTQNKDVGAASLTMTPGRRRPQRPRGEAPRSAGSRGPRQVCGALQGALHALLFWKATCSALCSYHLWGKKNAVK